MCVSDFENINLQQLSAKAIKELVFVKTLIRKLSDVATPRYNGCNLHYSLPYASCTLNFQNKSLLYITVNINPVYSLSVNLYLSCGTFKTTFCFHFLTEPGDYAESEFPGGQLKFIWPLGADSSNVHSQGPDMGAWPGTSHGQVSRDGHFRK